MAIEFCGLRQRCSLLFWQTFTLISVSMLSVMAGSIIAPSLPDIEDHFEGKAKGDVEIQARLIVTLPFLFIAIVGPFAGFFINKYGRKPCLLWGLLVFVLAGTSGAYLDNLLVILLFRMVVGIAIAFFQPAATTLITDYFPVETRPKILGFQSAAMSLIGGFTFINIAGLFASIHWRGVFYCYFFGLPFLLLSLWLLKEPELEKSPSQSHTTTPSYPPPQSSHPPALSPSTKTCKELDHTAAVVLKDIIERAFPLSSASDCTQTDDVSLQKRQQSNSDNNNERKKECEDDDGPQPDEAATILLSDIIDRALPHSSSPQQTQSDNGGFSLEKGEQSNVNDNEEEKKHEEVGPRRSHSLNAKAVEGDTDGHKDTAKSPPVTPETVVLQLPTPKSGHLKGVSNLFLSVLCGGAFSVHLFAWILVVEAPFFLEEELDQGDKKVIALVLSIVALVGGTSSLVFSYIRHLLSTRCILVLIYAGFTLGYFFLVIAHHWATVIPAMVFCGLGFGVGRPLIISIASQRVLAEERARVMSALTASLFAGSFAAAVVAAPLLLIVDTERGVFAILCGVTGLVTIIMLLLSFGRKLKGSKEILSQPKD
eukprot:GCRY01005826.1.p1 GENE.GCRY01005826.1~~GCRY01005826.1.p1  ORF type:complete len:596 (-),score=144.65 GCRY01005826.1:631-2418(-)